MRSHSLPASQPIVGLANPPQRHRRLLALHQRACGFRALCFVLAALIWWLLQNPWIALGCAGWPLLLHWLLPKQVARFPSWCGNRPLLELAALHLVEAFVTVAVFVTGDMPALALTASALCLVAAGLAQGGTALGAGVLAAIAVAFYGFGAPGFAADAWYLLLHASIEPIAHANSNLANVLGLLMLALLGLGLSYSGYRRSLAIHRSRLHWQRRQRTAATFNQRLVRYLPDALLRRLTQLPVSVVPASGLLPLSWQRRWVAVAFVDLVEFTELSNRLAPEQVARVLNHHLQQLDWLATQHECSLCRFIGDGVLLLWGDPEPAQPQQQVQRAVGLALQVPGVVAASERHWQQQGYGLTLQARVAIASGYCTLGDWGSRQLDYSVVGPAVNLAQRLQQHADPGTTLLDEASSAVFSGHAGTIKHWRWLELKGFGRVRAFALCPPDPNKPSARPVQ